MCGACWGPELGVKRGCGLGGIWAPADPPISEVFGGCEVLGAVPCVGR